MTIGKRSLPPGSSVSFIKLGALLDDSCFQNGIYKHSDKYGNGTPILRITDFDNHGRLTSSSLKRVALSPLEQNQYAIREHDILINRVNSLSHIGKSMLVPSMDEYPVFESNMMRIRIKDECPLAPEYVAAVLQAEPARKHFRKVAKPAVAQASINQDDVRSVAIVLYPKSMQRWIAKALFNWDLAVEKTEQLIAAKERHYSHELSRLISRGQHPHSHVGTFAEEVSARNRGGNGARVLSVTNSRGFVLPEEQFERRVASADLSNYKVVQRGQYAYNPSRINVGSIARLDGWDEGVLSPMYVVFRLDEDKVDSDYFLHWLNSHEARQRIKNSAQGSVRETVSFSEFAAITIPLPDTTTQTAIARYLNALREEIDLLCQSVTALKTQKRGLMQKLLTGQWRLPMHETNEKEITPC
jgi:type I restriction enzyme S subunit